MKLWILSREQMDAWKLNKDEACAFFQLAIKISFLNSYMFRHAPRRRVKPLTPPPPCLFSFYLPYSPSDLSKISIIPSFHYTPACTIQHQEFVVGWSNGYLNYLGRANKEHLLPLSLSLFLCWIISTVLTSSLPVLIHNRWTISRLHASISYTRVNRACLSEYYYLFFFFFPKTLLLQTLFQINTISRYAIGINNYPQREFTRLV